MKSSVWVAALILLLAGGCIHLEQTVMLNGDGTLVVRYHYSIAEESAELMGAGRRVVEGWQGKQPGGAPDWFTSEAAVRRHFTGPGLRLQQFRSFSKGGRHHIDILVFAEDGPAAINSGVFGAFRCERTANDTVRLWADVPHVSADVARMDDASIEALCDDLYLQLEFQVPGKIATSTAPETSRRTATWRFDPATGVDFLRSPSGIQCDFAADRLEWAAKLPVGTP